MITSDILKTTAAALNDSISHLVKNVYQRKMQTTLATFLITSLGMQKPINFFSAANVINVRKLVFEDEGVGEIVLDLVANFNMRSTLTNAAKADLINQIALACSLPEESAANALNLIPAVYKERIPTFNSVKELLDHNDWLLVCALILFYTETGMITLVPVGPPDKTT